DIVYDEVNCTIRILKKCGTEIQMPMLSSGEKQIVSLFSHLYLDQDVTNIIFIDEPELSLSVDWQRLFLPDIEETGTCGLIAAVTHSPFIFENSFDDYAVDLELQGKVEVRKNN
ncbi:AAA family ATPase, partial [Curvivirga aplysinae]|uniref:AAA family ATPase n=1 Tax=Curvivirga aplysinae TaxID=2529852 RepID=UPI0012BD4040